MKKFFKNFKRVLKDIKETPEVKEKLKNIKIGLEKCSDKMSSACKFIDFFVHDILDYTLLNKESKNFMKDMKIFEAKAAVREITEILEDKYNLKKITLETKLVGFKQTDLVKTDKKRLQ